eukprot:TRINITY_DN56033_c0_g1_i1.p1 TRINITY_DN56033_c0_g1~~TRINITY_DN56033_c0_g1_i1.p1  ORF type:complete len:165 (+),score=6.17 TRINITY_DN56033_c0_g1_i1:39-533(+)
MQFPMQDLPAWAGKPVKIGVVHIKTGPMGMATLQNEFTIGQVFTIPHERISATYPCLLEEQDHIYLNFTMVDGSVGYSGTYARPLLQSPVIHARGGAQHPVLRVRRVVVTPIYEVVFPDCLFVATREGNVIIGPDSDQLISDAVSQDPQPLPGPCGSIGASGSS